MNLKRTLAITMILIGLFMVIGCEKLDQTNSTESLDHTRQGKTKDQAEYGGQLVLPLTRIESLNPLANENKTYYHFSKLIFEGLFDLDKNLNGVKLLAEDYKIKEDGTISIQLKDDIHWHDGKNLSTQDVAFTIDRIKSLEDDHIYMGIWQDMLGVLNHSHINKIIDTKIIDDKNIDIIFDKNYSHGLEMLTFPILAKHQGKGSMEDDFFPIGTGPYKFVEYKKDKTIKLSYNDDYRDGRPYIDQIIGKIFEDEELILMGFETGQIDASITLDEEWERYEQRDRKTLEFVSGHYEFLALNSSKGLFNGQEGRLLKKAIAYGIDRQAIIKEIYSGHASQSDLPIHPNSWLLSSESNAYGYSLQKAKEYIEKSGWKDMDGDGYYQDQNGKQLSLKLLTNSYNPLRLESANMIAKEFDRMGIHIIKDYPEIIPDHLTEELVDQQWEEVNRKISRGDFDMVLGGWDLSPIQDLAFALHSSQIKSGSNISRYNNPFMDQALVEALNQSNKENKLKAYEKIQEIIIKDLPYIGLYFKNNALLVNEKVMGEIHPCFYNIYKDIDKWYIPKEYH